MAQDDNPVRLVWNRVRFAREDFISFQDALLELAAPSKDGNQEQDTRKRLAKKLVERLGHGEISDDKAIEIFESVEALLKKSSKVRETNPEATSSEQATLLESELGALASSMVAAGLSGEFTSGIISKYIKLVSRLHPRSAIMLESLLISAVSSFELFISRLISASLKFDPSPLDNPDRQFEYGEIVGFANISDFIQDTADKFTDFLMRDPMEDWLKFLSRSLRQNDLAWINAEMNEILQRRHVHVHNGGKVSRSYLDNIAGSHNLPKLNDRLPVTTEYLETALDKMAAVVLYLSHAAFFSIRASKKATELAFDESDGSTNQTAYDLLFDCRYGAIANTYERMKPLFWVARTREYYRANCWQARKMLNGLDSIRAEVEGWDVSLSPIIELAKFSLLEDVVRAQPLLERLMAEGELNVIDAATWPILEPLRRHAAALRDFGSPSIE